MNDTLDISAERVIRSPSETDPWSARTDVRRRFGLEVLRSENVRATVLAGTAAAGIGAVLLHVALWEDRSTSLTGDATLAFAVIGIAAAVLVFELAIRRVLRNRIERNAPIPPGLRYVNAAAEISAVTIALVYVGQATGSPDVALNLPISAVYFLLIILSTLRLDPAVSLFSGAVAAGEYALVAGLTAGRTPSASVHSGFDGFYVEHAAVLLAGGVIAALVSQHITRRVSRALRTLEERDRILDMFGQHTSPAVVDEILTRESGWKGERRQVCVMFLDIRDFAVFSENHTPEEVVDYLNRLLGSLIEIVHRHNGNIHQLLGDGFMAVFGAPVAHGDDLEHAVDAAMEAVEFANDASEAGLIPETRLGVALHAGEAVVGLVGSAEHKEYKVTGDVVNLAARLEDLNKRLGSQVLVSETVWHAVRSSGYASVDLGETAVKGYSRPLHVYRLA